MKKVALVALRLQILSVLKFVRRSLTGRDWSWWLFHVTGVMFKETKYIF